MKTQLEVTKHRLFSEEGLRVANIKLFPGSNRETSGEKVGEQLNKAIAQLEVGDYEIVDLDTEH